MLKAEGAKVDKVGSATVDGTATTHYRVKIDMAKALKAKGLTSPVFNVAWPRKMKSSLGERLGRPERARPPGRNQPTASRGSTPLHSA